MNPPSRTTRASEIGGECERALYYSRTVPAEMRQPHDASLQALFDLGNDVEMNVVRRIEEMGISVLQRGKDYLDTDLELSAHVDLRVMVMGLAVPIEIKGLSPHVAPTIRDVKDIRDSRFSYVRRYYGQIQTYIRFARVPVGVFAIENKGTGAIGFIDAPRDDDCIASLEARALRVKEAVARGEPLPRYTGDHCERCPFLAPCAPDRDFGPGVQIIDDSHLIAAIERREKLHPAAKEFKEIDEEVKDILKVMGVSGEVLAGDFAIVASEVERKAYAVAAGKHVQFKIKRVAPLSSDILRGGKP